MPSIWSNFYINIESLEQLNNVLEDEFEKLTTLFLALEEEVNTIESEEYWVGESFTSFKTNFDEWKLKYLKSLAQLAKLEEYVRELRQTGSDLIDIRNNMKCEAILTGNTSGQTIY
ncbi:hypothetical protein [uncultured Clostridium sp.]|jgi:uncharacterized protein YukE|uniref:hypothetical protein n=1 Tax=uncultured Clostridium sp. TaxID=59620 RepID=UPI002615EE49|nr:hypothetical protein [uncultured Clostridium sp.]